uniref:CAZy families GH51 protein n=2 Tax=uncultured Streptosporangium sp. TaxID=668992 RepID=A0A060CHW6_9ACTN|nr:CAZy families GH51 protein [uncultured Streptosporangium sp.]
MTAQARVRLDPAFRIAPVNRRIFGSFVEHMGRCVYTGIYEPGHPSADAHGFRRDVATLVRELGPTLLRYPGGNFVSNYRWETASGRSTSGPRVSTTRGARSRPTRSAPMSSSPGASG